MTGNNLFDAMNHLDPRLIEQSAPDRWAKKSQQKIIPWIKWAASAACLCLVLAVAAGAVYQLRDQGSQVPPIYEHAYLSAEEVGKLFEGTRQDNYGATTSYTKVYRPANRPFQLAPLPAEEYADIFNIPALTKPLSKPELTAFTTAIAPKLMATLGTTETAFVKKEIDLEGWLITDYHKSNMTIAFNQTAIGNNSNYVFVDNGNMPLTLNGKELSIDQRQSEEDIIASLVWARDILFEVFDRRFDSVEVTFDYDGRHLYGAESIRVVYYNESDGPHQGDRIVLRFDNDTNRTEAIASPDIINRCSIGYYAYRIPPNEYYSVEATCKLLSLQQAEALLAGGYVFGGHSCPLCMAQQDKVSFEGYDFVEFCYLTDYDAQHARSIPFYAFYKKIGTAENGNDVYAKTYVCAVEVSGLEEYFQKQASQHQNFSFDITAP